ncbi:MAG: hypothetical protein WD876_01430 [Candidatus Pacearchaeota archaeon]
MKEKEIRFLLELELKKMWGEEVIAIYSPPRVRYFQTDIFGVFDVVTIAPSSQLPYFIQITTLNHRAHRYKKIREWLYKYNLYSFNSAWLFCYDKKKNIFKKEIVSLKDFTG